MKSPTTTTLALLAAVSLSGCMSTSGIPDAKESFGCKAPAGVNCTSVSGVYANAMQNNLPAQRAAREAGAAPAARGIVERARDPLPVALPGVPIRSQERTLRIWMAPWVDEEGDLRDQTFLYVVVKRGNWMVDQTQEATVQKTLTRPRVASPLSRASTSQNRAASNEERGQVAAEEVVDQSTQIGSAR